MEGLEPWPWPEAWRCGGEMEMCVCVCVVVVVGLRVALMGTLTTVEPRFAHKRFSRDSNWRLSKKGGELA